MDERIYQIALSLLNGIGPIKAKNLVCYTGSAQAVFKESEKNLGKIEGIGWYVSKGLGRSEALARAERELAYIEKNNIQLYYYKDPNYPSGLKPVEDGPIVLFCKGNINFNLKNIAVVGTRKSTPYGKKMTDKFVTDLAPMGVQIVSGLAHGIDKAAHEAALDNSLPTIGVLGHGLDTMYPAAHRGLAESMLAQGGLMTEFVSGTPGDPKHFPRRNRIVAGLCEALVVIESSESGGSMITANLANDYNRDVFAFPGNADRESSKGCNNLIRRDKAHLITCAEDMVNIMGWEMKEKQDDLQTNLFVQMTEDEERLVAIFREKGELDIDNLSFAASMTSSVLSLHLFNLEMKGMVKALPGKRYSLI